LRLPENLFNKLGMPPRFFCLSARIAVQFSMLLGVLFFTLCHGYRFFGIEKSVMIEKSA